MNRLAPILLILSFLSAPTAYAQDKHGTGLILEDKSKLPPPTTLTFEWEKNAKKILRIENCPSTPMCIGTVKDSNGDDHTIACKAINGKCPEADACIHPSDRPFSVLPEGATPPGAKQTGARDQN